MSAPPVILEFSAASFLELNLPFAELSKVVPSMETLENVTNTPDVPLVELLSKNETLSIVINDNITDKILPFDALLLWNFVALIILSNSDPNKYMALASVELFSKNILSVRLIVEEDMIL